jgi:diaminopimelate decarboxylase
MSVFVVSKCCEGWNSVIAVFHGAKFETLERRFPFPQYLIDEIDVEKNLKDWPKEGSDE